MDCAELNQRRQMLPPLHRTDHLPSQSSPAMAGTNENQAPVHRIASNVLHMCGGWI
jgi:hypothetical protein